MAGGFAMLLATALAVATDVASGLMPAGWDWLRQPWVMWSVVAALALASAMTASTPDGAARGTNPVVIASPIDGTPHARRWVRRLSAQKPGRWRPWTPQVAPAPVPGKLPPQNPHFTGRKGLLKTVRRHLSSRPGAVVAIQGLGGIGKSQLALEYAYRSRDAGVYEIIWWLRAQSRLTLAEDLAALAPELGVTATTDTLAAVRAQLQRQGGWLLIFDDAGCPADLRGWLPGGDGHVIITSRNHGWGDIAMTVEVPTFTRADSVKYLRNRVGGADPAMDELAGALGDLPLALAQAASYVDLHRGPSITGYLDLYRDREGGGRLLATGLDGYPESVATTWLIHFDELATNHPAALQLLRLCSHLNPDDIDLTVLLSNPDLLAGRLTGRLAAVSHQPERIEETIGTLARTGLLTRLDDRRVRLHCLVSQVIRHHLALRSRARLGRDVPARWARHACAVLDGLFPNQPREQATWPLCTALAPHVVAATDIAIRRRAASSHAGSALSRLGVYLKSRGELTAARTTLHMALKILEEEHRPDQHRVAHTLVDLGNVHRHLGEFLRARECQRRALGIFAKTYGPNHADAGHALGKLAIVERELGNLKAAEDTQRQALAVLERAHGPDHADVARALTNLGNVQHQSGQFAMACKSLQRALTILEAVHGPDHPEVARALGNLGLVYRDLGNLDAAYNAQERALAVIETTYGPRHPDVVRTLTNLGGLQHRSGRSAAAEATLMRALGISEDLHRSDHPDTARILILLGQVRAAGVGNDAP